MNSFYEIVFSTNYALLFSSALFFSIAPLPAIALSQREARSELPRLFILLLSLTIIGGVCGLAGGLSREGVVGDIIPAVLGVAAGLSIHLFGIDTSRGTFASIAFAAFSLSLMTCYVFGGSIWSAWHFDQGFNESCRSLFFDPEIYKDVETMERVFGDETDGLFALCQRFWESS